MRPFCSAILLAGVVLLATALPGTTGQLSGEHILSAGEDITIVGTAISIAGDLHANESIRLEGQDIHILGAVEAGETVRTGGRGILANVLVTRALRMQIPAVDFGALRQTAADVRSGSARFTGVFLARGITYVRGDASLQAVVAGAGALVAEGDLSIHAPGARFPIIGETAFITRGDLRIRGSGLALRGFFLAPEGEIDIQASDIRLQGMLMAKRIRINGRDIRMDFDPSVQALTGSVRALGVELRPPQILSPRQGEVMGLSPDLPVFGAAAAGATVQLTLRAAGSSEVLATARVAADAAGRFSTLMRLPLAMVPPGRYVLTAVALHPLGGTSPPATVTFQFKLHEP